MRPELLPSLATLLSHLEWVLLHAYLGWTLRDLEPGVRAGPSTSKEAMAYPESQEPPGDPAFKSKLSYPSSLWQWPFQPAAPSLLLFGSRLRGLLASPCWVSSRVVPGAGECSENQVEGGCFHFTHNSRCLQSECTAKAAYHTPPWPHTALQTYQN